jgi:hypothetical protein
MNVLNTSLAGVLIIGPKVIPNHRGLFHESWNAREFDAAGIRASFVQDNHSISGRNVLRSLHYQIRQPQGKGVRVVAGEVYDVALDLRRSSATSGQWEGITLSATNRRMVGISARPCARIPNHLGACRAAVHDDGLLAACAGAIREGREGDALRSGRDLSVSPGPTSAGPHWQCACPS